MARGVRGSDCARRASGENVLARRPEGVDPLALLAVLVLVGVLWIAPFYAVEIARGGRIRADAVTLVSVTYVALFASVAAYALWNAGVARVGASRAGVFLHLMPAFGSLLAKVRAARPRSPSGTRGSACPAPR